MNLEQFEDEWYIALDGEVSEPMSFHALRVYLDELGQQEELYVWRQGMEAWASPDEVAGLLQQQDAALFSEQEQQELEGTLRDLLAHDGAIWAGAGLSEAQRRALSKQVTPAREPVAVAAPAPSPRPTPRRRARVHTAAKPPTLPPKKRTWLRLALLTLLLVAMLGGLLYVLDSPTPIPEPETALAAQPLPAASPAPRPSPRRRTVSRPPTPVNKVPGLETHAATHAPPPAPRAVTNTPAARRQAAIASLQALVRKREGQRDALIKKLSDARGLSKEQIDELRKQANDLNRLISASLQRIVRLKQGKE